MSSLQRGSPYLGFYVALFETYFNGRTPGKWMMGICVLSVNSEPIDGLQATLRSMSNNVAHQRNVDAAVEADEVCGRLKNVG